MAVVVLRSDDGRSQLTLIPIGDRPIQVLATAGPIWGLAWGP